MSDTFQTPNPMDAARRQLETNAAGVLYRDETEDRDQTEEPLDEQAPTEQAQTEQAQAEMASEAPAAEMPAAGTPDTGTPDTGQAQSEQAQSPFHRQGKWFVVHTQSGYEKKVKQNLEARMASLDLSEKIHEIEVPMEDVIEFKNGRKVVVKKKIFPGYLLIRCENDEQTHIDIKATPGITGFAGPGGKPVALRQREVETFLQAPEPGDESQRRTKPSVIYEIDESVRIKEGPFSDFQGQVVEINEEHLRVKVLVNIFGRETPVELEFSQVAKI